MYHILQGQIHQERCVRGESGPPPLIHNFIFFIHLIIEQKRGGEGRGGEGRGGEGRGGEGRGEERRGGEGRGGEEHICTNKG